MSIQMSINFLSCQMNIHIAKFQVVDIKKSPVRTHVSTAHTYLSNILSTRHQQQHLSIKAVNFFAATSSKQLITHIAECLLIGRHIFFFLLVLNFITCPYLLRKQFNTHGLKNFEYTKEMCNYKKLIAKLGLSR